MFWFPKHNWDYKGKIIMCTLDHFLVHCALLHSAITNGKLARVMCHKWHRGAGLCRLGWAASTQSQAESYSCI